MEEDALARHVRSNDESVPTDSTTNPSTTASSTNIRSSWSVHADVPPVNVPVIATVVAATATDFPLAQSVEDAAISSSEDDQQSITSIGDSIVHLPPRFRAVNFEVKNEANASRFLTELLTNLQLAKPTASLSPTPGDLSNALAFDDTASLPKGGLRKAFVNTYLRGLAVVDNTLTNKFWMVCNTRLSDLKKIPTFLNWLKGEETSRRIQMVACYLPGTERRSVGIFVNVVTRNDLTGSFADRMRAVLLKRAPSQAVPTFQIEARMMLPLFLMLPLVRHQFLRVFHPLVTNNAGLSHAVFI